METFITAPKYLLGALLILSITLCLTPKVSAQSVAPDTDQYGRWIHGIGEPLWFDDTASKQEVERLKARWMAIDVENLKGGKESLGGDYGSGGETHGSVLRWSASAGFVMLHVDKCAARVTGFRHGSVIITATKLQLIPEGKFSRSNNHSHGHSRDATDEFLFVKWRNILYLTTEDQIGEFLDSLAGLGKYNENSYWETPAYAKSGMQETGSADDLPIVPRGYERFVKRPINLTITAIGQRVVRRLRVEDDAESHYESRTPVTIRGGRSEGVKPGMKFWVLDSGESDEVVVRTVGRHVASGVIVRWVEENSKTHFSEWPDYPRYREIKVGWKLSTSIHKLLDSAESKSN